MTTEKDKCSVISFMSDLKKLNSKQKVEWWLSGWPRGWSGGGGFPVLCGSQVF